MYAELPEENGKKQCDDFFLSLTCGAAEGAAPGIGPYAPVGAVVDAPVAAAGAPQPAHTAEPGAIGCPQLAQKPVPSPFCAPQAAQKAWSSFNCAPHFLQNIHTLPFIFYRFCTTMLTYPCFFVNKFATNR